MEASTTLKPNRGALFFEPLEGRILMSTVQAWPTSLPTESIPMAQIASELLWSSDNLLVSSPWQFGGAGNLINLDAFHDDARFDGIDGSGFSVAILDTGIDLDHPFFGPDSDGDGVADRIVYNEDFVGNDPNAQDGNGHGSNVSSIIASSDLTYPGVAPGVDIIHLQVLSDNGSGTFAGIEAALQWVVDNTSLFNIVAVNMSLGDGGNYASAVSGYGLSDEFAALAAQDVIVVTAAGNSFYGAGSLQGVSYPAADPNTLAVGAVYADGPTGWYYGSGAKAYSTAPDRIAPFSQRHTVLTEVFAPGAPITGASATGGLNVMHGTSQAAPQVAGAAVLAQHLAQRELGRRLTVAEFTQLLRDNSVTINDGDDENDNVTNTGADFARLDMLALAEAILAPDMLAFDAGTDAHYFDAAGRAITVSLTGPGQGEVLVDAAGGWSIEVHDTTDQSTLSITPDLPTETTTLVALNVFGALDRIDAARVDLNGDLTVNGNVADVVLRDVSHGRISVGAESAGSQTLTLSFRRLEDVSIDSALPILSLTAVEWIDQDANADSITAPAVYQLAMRGSRQLGLAGDFAADLNITGANSYGVPGAPAIGYVQIAGALTDADWQIVGNVGRIAAGQASDWSLLVAGDVRVLRFGSVDNAHLTVSGSIHSILAEQWNQSSLDAGHVVQNQLPGGAVLAAGDEIDDAPLQSKHEDSRRAAAIVDAAITAWSSARARLELTAGIAHIGPDGGAVLPVLIDLSEEDDQEDAGLPMQLPTLGEQRTDAA